MPPETLCRYLRLVIAATGLLLLGTTWRLWLGWGDFPQVPMVEWFTRFPAWCDGLAGGLMALSLVLIFFRPANDKLGPVPAFVFAGAFLLAVLLNQHRLQPWAYEFCILLLVMALLPASRAVWCLRLIVASIYLHSGLSKLDVTFLTSHGEAMISVLTNALGWDFAAAPLAVRRTVVALLPVGEIALFVGLLLRRTRRAAKWVSVGMHLVLLGILGPWGLGHKPGVLIWNAYFIAQNLLLFREVHSSESEPTSSASWRIVTAYGFVGLVVLLPFLEPFGLYDHWPAWAVYASRPERTRVYIAENRIPDLPALAPEFFTEEEPPADAVERFLAGKLPWRRLRIDRWSLEALSVPIYPQDRFQVGVALALGERCELEEDIRVEIDSPANRWTGQRSMRVLEGTNAIREAAREYRLGARPRNAKADQ